MKLKNKFLPLITSIAAVTATTPLALVSCNDDNGPAVEMVDISADDFECVIPQAELAAPIRQAEATSMYVEAIKENPAIFAEDVKAFMHNKWHAMGEEFEKRSQYLQDPELEWKKLEIGVSNITLGSTTVSYPGEKPMNYPTASFKIVLNVDALVTGDYVPVPTPFNESTDTYSFELKGSISLNINNCIFYFYPRTQSKNREEFENASKHSWMPSWDATEYNTDFNGGEWCFGLGFYGNSNSSYASALYPYQYCDDPYKIDVDYYNEASEIFTSGTTGARTEDVTIEKYNGKLTKYSDILSFAQLMSSSENYEYLPFYFTFDFCSHYMNEIYALPEIQQLTGLSAETCDNAYEWYQDRGVWWEYDDDVGDFIFDRCAPQGFAVSSYKTPTKDPNKGIHHVSFTFEDTAFPRYDLNSNIDYLDYIQNPGNVALKFAEMKFGEMGYDPHKIEPEMECYPVFIANSQDNFFTPYSLYGVWDDEDYPGLMYDSRFAYDHLDFIANNKTLKYKVNYMIDNDTKQYSETISVPLDSEKIKWAFPGGLIPY